MSGTPVVARIGSGMYRVELEGRTEIVHVAGPRDRRWVHWNGAVFERPFAPPAPSRRRGSSADAHQALSAPMPSTVRKILIDAGSRVTRGDTLLVLEAMKMELPIRAASDGVVRAVLCREGDLVQAGTTLAELE